MAEKNKVEITGDVRVRYAPSPTGFLHIGNAQSALFNYLFAKHYKGTWVLRIEDTDTKRNVEHGEESQMENLHWLGIDWDEGPDKPNPKYGPYHQTERIDTYQKYIDQLLEAGIAYKDYATAEELEAMREEQIANHEAPHYDGRWYNASEEMVKEAEAKGIKPTIRLHLPENHVYEWDDLVKGHVEFNSDNLGGDFIIVKSNGIPTYNFAVVIDDYLMDITHVLRGDDHIANTPKQLAIYEALGLKQPRFGHLSLIYSLETGKKLSKRDKDTLQFISQYRANGYLSEAVLNFIAFLGWSPEGEQEIFSREELIKAYDINRMSSSPAFFDQKKLDWINAEYMKKLSVEELIQRIGELVEKPETEEAEEVRNLGIMQEHDFVEKVVKLYRGEAKTLLDLMRKLIFMWTIDTATFSYDDFEGFKLDVCRQVLTSLRKQLESHEEDVLSADEYNQILNEVKNETGANAKHLYMTLNIAFTGSKSSPQIVDVMEILPIKTLIHLIDKAINALDNLLSE